MRTGISLLDFVYDVPDVQITMENVADIKTDQFEELQKELQTMARKLHEKDEEWKEERLKFEEQRVEDAEINKKPLENIKEVHKKEMDQLESILFDDALQSVGLDFGFLKKAEKEAMKQELKEASSDSIEEKLSTKSEKAQNPIPVALIQNHSSDISIISKIELESEERRRRINEEH